MRIGGNCLRVLRRATAELIPAFRRNLLRREAPLKQASPRHAGCFPIANDLRTPISRRVAHQIAAHAPEQSEQCRPEKKQRWLQAVALHQPEDTLLLTESVHRLIHPNYRASAGQKIEQYRA